MSKIALRLTIGVMSFGIASVGILAYSNGKTEENIPKHEPYLEAVYQENGNDKTALGEEKVSNTSLEELTALLGMGDKDTAELLGGGEENWSTDKELYIGRIYQINLYDESFPVYTTCDDQGIVNAVSVWLSNGEREVQENEVNLWIERITEYAKVDPIEGMKYTDVKGSNWKWITDGNIISLKWRENLLTININPAIGELQ